jgi:predicted alpha/beta superfamily hydrolase
MKRCFYFLLLFLNPFSTIAQSDNLPEVSLKNTEVRIIESSIVENTSYEVHISLPANYSQTNESYSVLYYLDAYHWGGIVIETYRLLRAFEEVKPLILFKGYAGEKAKSKRIEY